MAAVLTHPIQYMVPLMRELSSRPGIDLTVYYLSRQGLDATLDLKFGQTFKWDIPLLGGYKSVFLPNLRSGSGPNGFFSLLNVSLFNEIRRNRYEVLLIHGYEHLIKWIAFIAARSCGTRLIFRGESHLNEPRSYFRRAMKRVVLGNLFKWFSGVAYIGKRNREYYEFYGVDPARLYFAPYCVDNAFFASGAENARSARDERRGALGVHDDAPVILYSGKLITLKQPEMLLRAFAAVRKRRPCHLVYVGDGVLREAIERRVAQFGIPDVHIAGFVNQSLLPEIYACGDIFVLPSLHEPWGLVVNEAMACGLPVIASDRVGSALDLVDDGMNGYVFHYNDQNALERRLETLVADRELRSAFGRRSRELISKYSVRNAADGIIAAAVG
jgi:glycosyltransferase involved in cell wall biosynthesis